MYVFLTRKTAWWLLLDIVLRSALDKWTPVGAVIGSRPHLGRAPQRFGCEQKVHNGVCSKSDHTAEKKRRSFRTALFY